MRTFPPLLPLLLMQKGSIGVAGQELEAGRMLAFRPGIAITVVAGDQGARLMLLGGETLNGLLYVW